MIQQLADIQLAITKVETALRRESRIGQDASEGDNQRLVRNLKQLLKTAGSFHSNASSSMGNRSTISNGTISRSSLTEEQIHSIRNWIPPPVELEAGTYNSFVALKGDTEPQSSSNPHLKQLSLNTAASQTRSEIDDEFDIV